MQLVSESVARNKLAPNISKTKSIVFGTKHSLNPKPKLNLVEMTKLLEVTLHCQLSWSKHIDAVVAKIRRSLSIIKLCLNNTINKQVLQALVSTFLTTLSTSRSYRPWFRRTLTTVQSCCNDLRLLFVESQTEMQRVGYS
jgi:hypothetical protein